MKTYKELEMTRTMRIARAVEYIARKDIPNIEVANTLDRLVKDGHITMDEAIHMACVYTTAEYSDETANKH